MRVPNGYRPLHARGEFEGHDLCFAVFNVCPDEYRPRDKPATLKQRRSAQDKARERAMQFVWDLPQVRRVETIGSGQYQFHRAARDAKGNVWACIVPSKSGMTFTVEYWHKSETSGNVP